MTVLRKKSAGGSTTNHPFLALSLAVMAASFSTFPLMADEFDTYYTATVGGYTYSYRLEGGKAIIEYSSKSGTVYGRAVTPAPSGSYEIPSSLNGHPVVGIGKSAFDYCGEMALVKIPGSVTSVGAYAFRESGLTSLVIPDSVTNVGEYAFCGCCEITNLVIGAGIAEISKGMFAGVGRLSLVIPDSVRSIGVEAFSLYHRDSDGRYTESSLQEVVIGAGVTNMESAFSDCYNLTNVVIRPGVTRIDDKVFNGCGLTSLVIPPSVTSIGGYAFSGCKELTSIVIPDNVTRIGDSAFSYCNGLTNAVIGTSVTNIGADAFCDCYELRSIEIPASVTNIGEGAFCSCYGITNFTVAAENPVYCVVNGILYSKDMARLICAVTEIGKSGDAEIPVGVTSIGADAFCDCYELRSIEIPASVTSIGADAFSGCGGLTNVVIGAGVTSIGRKAFYWCKGLTSIVIPDSVTNIGVSAFSNCDGLTSIVIPDSVTNIGVSAFSNCDGLTNAVIGTGVKSIGGYAFSLCTSLTSIVIPDSVTSIGIYAFRWCFDLTSVVIPSSVTSIGSEAFSKCGDLTSVVYKGNAPSTVGEGIYAGTPDTLTNYVGIGSTGWSGTPGDAAIPSTWQGRPITTILMVKVDQVWLSGFNLVKDGDYEAAATNICANGLPAWKNYVAGLVPTNPASQFTASITFTNDLPYVSWTPNYPASRIYTVEGKTNLNDAAWVSPTNTAHRFFRVKVELK